MTDFSIEAIRARKDEVAAVPAADGGYYTAEARAVADRLILLAYIDDLTEAARWAKYGTDPDATCECGHPVTGHQTGEGAFSGWCGEFTEDGPCGCEKPTA